MLLIFVTVTSLGRAMYVQKPHFGRKVRGKFTLKFSMCGNKTRWAVSDLAKCNFASVRSGKGVHLIVGWI